MAETDIVHNADGSVNTCLGRAVERYIYSLPIVTAVKLNCQSRKKVNEAIKNGLITLERVAGAFDHVEWRTNKRIQQSTNRLDDTISLTNIGMQRAVAARDGNGRDIGVWR